MNSRLDHDAITEKIKSKILSYDNMCHVDNMRLCKEELPLPLQLNTLWTDVGKVIDGLHLRNNVDPKFKRNYNPDDRVPKEFNFMAAEQIFVWASRMKKFVCAMPRFCLRNATITSLNAYTQRCRKASKQPILPKLSKHTQH